MSQASLREQMQAVASQLSDTFKESNKKKPVKDKQRVKKNRSDQLASKKDTAKHAVDKSVEDKPKWLQYAQKGVGLLQYHFSDCFKDRHAVQPLKVGIKKDLIKRLESMDIKNEDKACMVKSLSYYVNTLSYHKKIVEGQQRIDLDGNAAGVVTAKEAQYSDEKVKIKKGTAESKQNRRPN